MLNHHAGKPPCGIKPTGNWVKTPQISAQTLPLPVALCVVKPLSSTIANASDSCNESKRSVGCDCKFICMLCCAAWLRNYPWHTWFSLQKIDPLDANCSPCLIAGSARGGATEAAQESRAGAGTMAWGLWHGAPCQAPTPGCLLTRACWEAELCSPAPAPSSGCASDQQ